MLENKIKVYVKIDENNCITDINSSIFLNNTENYIYIDEGNGDKYAHAQGMYLSKGLIDNQGRYNYKYVDNKVVELTEEEKESLFPIQEQQSNKQEELINKLIVDNINMQMQMDSLIESQLGGI